MLPYMTTHFSRWYTVKFRLVSIIMIPVKIIAIPMYRVAVAREAKTADNTKDAPRRSSTVRNVHIWTKASNENKI